MLPTQTTSATGDFANDPQYYDLPTTGAIAMVINGGDLLFYVLDVDGWVEVQ